jgi:hypothetical protein
MGVQQGEGKAGTERKREGRADPGMSANPARLKLQAVGHYSLGNKSYIRSQTPQSFTCNLTIKFQTRQIKEANDRSGRPQLLPVIRIKEADDVLGQGRLLPEAGICFLVVWKISLFWQRLYNFPTI